MTNNRKKTNKPAKQMKKSGRKPVKKAAKAVKKNISKAKPVKEKEKKIKIKKPSKEEIEAAEKQAKLKELKEERAKVAHVLGDSAVRQMLIDLGGENALTIIKNFYGNQSDEEMAKKLKLKISDVRATLNRLHSEGIVNYVRAKDNDTGWYSYSWSLNRNKMERWVSEQSERMCILKDESCEYYFCDACGAPSIVDFNTASDSSFKCARCNKSLDYVDEKIAERLTEGYKRKI